MSHRKPGRGLRALPGIRSIETRSAPAFSRCYPRSFTFYLGNPFPRFRRGNRKRTNVRCIRSRSKCLTLQAAPMNWWTLALPSVVRLVSLIRRRILNVLECARNFMKTFLPSFGILFGFLLPLSTPSARAADHNDAPAVTLDRGGEISDVYSFLDPNDNRQLVVIGATHGFIVPGEALNFGVFDSRIRLRFNFENTGDAVPDRSITVTFSQRTSTSTPQTATIRFSRPRQRSRRPRPIPQSTPPLLRKSSPPSPTASSFSLE
jgi:Domain of unknown function (DUF4331)